MSIHSRKPVFFGILVILFGITMLLNNFKLIEVDLGHLIATFWPVIFIIWGLDLIVPALSKQGPDGKDKKSGSVVTGIILIAVGSMLISHNTGLYMLNISIIWKINGIF
jgi:lia operon protein LiaF